MSGHIMQRSEIDTNFAMIDAELTVASKMPPRHVAIFFDEAREHIETHAMDTIYRRPGRNAVMNYLNSVWPNGAVECLCFDNNFMPPILASKITRKPKPRYDVAASRRMFLGREW